MMKLKARKKSASALKKIVGLFSAVTIVLGTLAGVTLPAQAAATDDFVFTVDTRIGDGAARGAYTLPLNPDFSAAGNYNFTVDWGDGIVETGLTYNSAGHSHGYSFSGVKTIRISGTFAAMQNYYSPTVAGAGATIANSQKLTNVTQWGTHAWKSMEAMFANTSLQATLSATGAPNLSSTAIPINASYTFANTDFFNSSLSGWNMTYVTTTAGMFSGAVAFNKPFPAWAMNNNTDMSEMFSGATVFNQAIGAWATYNVTNMHHMFYNAKAFNQALGTGTTSSWYTPKVTNMSFMFAGATAFNSSFGPNWNTTIVTNMSSMFSGATAFNQNIGAWNITNVTNISSMLSGATVFNQNLSAWNISKISSAGNALDNSNISLANYDALLTGWSGKVRIANVTLGVVSQDYCSATPKREIIIENSNWRFIGDRICAPTVNASSQKNNVPITGTGVPTATVTATVAGTGYTAVVNAGGVWSIPVRSGNWPIGGSAIVDQTDKFLFVTPITATSTSLGNYSISLDVVPNVSFTDGVAPIAPVISAPTSGAVVADSTPTISGTGEVGATVTVLNGATTLCTATVVAGGTWTCVSSTLAQGSVTITVTQKDAANNVSPAATRTFTVNLAPPTPVITAPAAGSVINDTTPTISGTGQASAVVTILNGATTLCTATVAVGGTWSCVSTVLAQGAITITATQEDTAGNVSPAASRSFTVDTVAPIAPVISTPTAGAVINDATPLISGTGETSAVVTVLNGATTVCTATVISGAWSCTPSAAFAEGSNTITATQKDSATNVSPSATRTFTVDTVAPIAPVIIMPATGSYINDNTPVISGSGEVGATVTPVISATVLCTAVVAAGGTWSCTSTVALINGAKTLTATQKDAANNVSPADTQTFTVDTVVPPAPFIGSPAAGSLINSNTPTISGTGEASALVTIFNGATTLCTATVAAGGAWSCVSSALSQGSITITATQMDAANNVSPASTRTFTVDSVDPAAPVITLPVNGAIVTTATPTISGTGEVAALVTVKNGATTLCTSTVAAGGTWSCLTSALSEGSITITATQTDAAGNVSPAATRAFTVDTLAPAAPVINVPANGALVTTLTPTISGTGEENATLTITRSGNAVCSITVDGSGNWTCTSATLPEGSVTITAIQMDAAGNTGVASNRTFNVDLPPAAPVFTSPAPGSTVLTSTPTISGIGEIGALVTVKNGGTTLCTATVSPYNDWSCVSSTIVDGPVTVTAIQNDTSGTAGPAATLSFIVDTAGIVAPVISSPANGSIISNNTPSISGTGVTAAVVIVKKGVTTLCTATVIAGGTWSCTSSALSEGSNTITAIQTDTLGKTSPSTSATFTVDTLVPAVPVISSPANGSFVATSTPTISGTGEIDALVTVKNGATTLCTATVTAGATWSCVSSALSQGSITVTATQKDTANNVSPSATRAFTVDTIAPPAPVIISPANVSTITTNTPTISGTGEVAAFVTVKNGATTLCTATVAAGATWSCVSSALSEGSITITATQSDSAGNVSTQSTRSFTVDTVAPVAPVISTPTNGALVNTNTPSISGTGEVAAVVTIKNGATTLCTDTVAAGGTWSCVPSTLSQGSNTLTVTQSDSVGNVSPAASITFTVDSIAPSAPFIVSPSAGSTINTTTPTVSGTGEAAALVSIKNGATTLCTVTVAAGGAWSCVTSVLSQGSITITATQTDVAGNLSSGSTRTFTVDTVAPAAPVISSPANSSAINTNTPLVSGTGEVAAIVIVAKAGTTQCTATVSAGGTWSCTPFALSQGSNTLTATQSDAAGNVSIQASTTFTVDTVAPTAPFIINPGAGATLNTTTPTINGTGEVAAVVTILNGATTLCTATVAAGGSWSCVSSALAQGSNTITATQRDTVGNVSPSASRTFTVSSVVSAAPVINTPTNGALISDTTPTISGTGDVASVVTILNGATTLCTATVAAGGAWSCDSVVLSQGSITITATQKDASNNVSPASSRTFTIDSIAPAAPVIINPASLTTVNTTTPTISGTGEVGAIVLVTKAAATVCMVAVASDGSWSCTSLIAFPQSVSSFAANQTDGAGNVSSNSFRSFFVDSIAPAAPVIVYPLAGANVNTTTPTISGSGEVGALVIVKKGATTLCSATVAASTTWSCVSPVLPQGSNTVTATQTDAVGNVSLQSSRSFNIDSIAPLAPVIINPVSLTTVNTITPIISGTGEDAAVVTVLKNTTTLCTATVASDGSWSCTSSALSQGVSTITATQKDAATNVSPVVSRTFSVDSIAPSAPTIFYPSINQTINSDNPTITGAGEAGALVVVKKGTTTLCSATVNGSNNWSCVSTILSQGANTITATQTDAAGYISPQLTRSFNVDSIAPLAPVIISPSAGGSTTETPTISGTGEASASVTVKNGLATLCTTTVSASGNWSCVSSTLAQGSITITVTQIDSAGSISPETSRSFTVDSITPAAPVFTNPLKGSIGNDNTPLLSGTGEAGTIVTAYRYSNTLCIATVASDGTWSCVSSPIQDGDFMEIDVSQTDGAGNMSLPARLIVSIDTVAPAPPVIIAPGVGTLSENRTPIISGTGEAYTNLTVKIAGAEVCTEAVIANSTWKCASFTLNEGLPVPQGPPVGQVTIVVTQRDAAGNVSLSTSRTFTVKQG